MSKNPYLEIFKKTRGNRFGSRRPVPYFDPTSVGKLADDFLSAFRVREECCNKYSFAVPNKDAIDAIVKYSPIVEIGAGTGYWAKLISEAGGKIRAYDSFDWEDLKLGEFFPVKKGSFEKVKAASKKHTLFLCWSPYNESLAYDCVKNFKGRFVIYVGEPVGGCTACEKYHAYMNKHFKVVEEVEIPQWEAVHDRLIVWERKMTDKKFKITIKKEDLIPKPRSPIKPSIQMKDKTKYTRKVKFKK